MTTDVPSTPIPKPSGPPETGRMQASLSLLMGIVTLLLLGETNASEPSGRSTPNIVYILCDDLGYGDVHCLNPKRGLIPTPNCDRLASQGRVFTDAHSSSSVCSPSRYSILTGRYGWRTRLQAHVLSGNAAPLIAPDRLTVPSLLRRHGYATACIGKWHMGMSIPKSADIPSLKILGAPTTVGFDSFFGLSASLDTPPFAFIENDQFVEPPTVTKTFGRTGPAAPSFEAVDVLPTLTSKAVEFIHEAKSPFFLYLPLTSPHTPIVPGPEWRGKSQVGDYGDFVMQTDWVVGQIMEALDKAGATDDTLLIVTSDNGFAPYVGLNRIGDFGSVSQIERLGHFPSADRRGYKSDIWDGGHRVPLIARWPRRVEAGSTCDHLVSLTDLMATCADLLGEKLPDEAGEDSFSMLPSLLGTADKPVREAVVYHSIHGSFAVQRGRWKLVLCPDSGGWSQPRRRTPEAQALPPMQLYDMHEDVGERDNQSSTQHDTVAQLTTLLETYVAEGRSTPGAPQKNDVDVAMVKSE